MEGECMFHFTRSYHTLAVPCCISTNRAGACRLLHGLASACRGQLTRHGVPDSAPSQAARRPAPAHLATAIPSGSPLAPDAAPLLSHFPPNKFCTPVNHKAPRGACVPLCHYAWKELPGVKCWILLGLPWVTHHCSPSAITPFSRPVCHPWRQTGARQQRLFKQPQSHQSRDPQNRGVSCAKRW